MICHTMKTPLTPGLPSARSTFSLRGIFPRFLTNNSVSHSLLARSPSRTPLPPCETTHPVGADSQTTRTYTQSSLHMLTLRLSRAASSTTCSRLQQLSLSTSTKASAGFGLNKDRRSDYNPYRNKRPQKEMFGGAGGRGGNCFNCGNRECWVL